MNPVLKRILAITAAVLLLVYIAVQAYLILVAPIETVTVSRATAYQTLETTGIIYRDETVLQEKTDGYLFYTVQNGGRVARQGTIANVFGSQQDALRQQELDKLDEEIATLESINAQGTSNRANLTTINRQINETWLALTTAAQGRTFTEMETLHARLRELLCKKQLTIGRVQNFDERLAALRAERTALAQSFTKAKATVSSPVAGYFISQTDGFEGYWKTADMKGLTVQDVRTALAHKPTAPAAIGKVVGNYEWYLACVVPTSEAAELKVGSSLEVSMPFVRNDAISMRVEAVNKADDGTAALILQCTEMDKELSTARVEEVDIRLKKYSGIRIPDSAIYFDEQQNPGVYVQTGNTLTFRRIRVLFNNPADGYAVCELTEDKNYAQLYDKIVTKGEDLYDGKLVR